MQCPIFFEKARKNLTLATDRQPTAHYSEVPKAQIILNMFDTYQSLLYLGESVDLDSAHKSYTSNVDFANRLIGYYDTLTSKESKNEREQRSNIFGTLGELSIILLLQRHTTNDLKTQNEVVLPSFFSEDRSLTSGGINESWDVTYLEKPDSNEPFGYRHKIQSKTRYHADSTKTYEDSIRMVYVNDNLKINRYVKDRRLPIFAIPIECDAELQNSDSKKEAGAALDIRTGRLFDVLMPAFD
jgi:hypothetical protein